MTLCLFWLLIDFFKTFDFNSPPLTLCCLRIHLSSIDVSPPLLIIGLVEKIHSINVLPVLGIPTIKILVLLQEIFCLFEKINFLLNLEFLIKSVILNFVKFFGKFFNSRVRYQSLLIVLKVCQALQNQH